MDKKVKKQVAKLILKKASTYINTSMVIFMLSLFLVSTSFLFLFKQYIQVDKDFISNDNVRMIEITGKDEHGNHSRSLKIYDENKLRSILSKYKGIRIYTMYQLNFGVEDEKGNRYFIYGVDEEAARFLGNCQLDAGVACSKLKTSQINLQIPIVQVEDGGMSSHVRSKFLVKNKQGILQKILLLYILKMKACLQAIHYMSESRHFRTSLKSPFVQTGASSKENMINIIRLVSKS